MKTSFLISIIFLLNIYSYCQNVDYSQLEMKKDYSGNYLLYLKSDTKPFTGTAERKWPNGNIENFDQYHKGKRDGKSTTYNADGNISSVINYKDGNYDGEMIYYHDNGAKNCEYIYNDGKQEKSFHWDTCGNLINESYSNSKNYYSKLYSWHKNGQKKSEAILINGQIDSTFTVWYESGIIKEIIHYRKGLWNGTWTDYDINGNIISQGEYKDDELIKGDQMYMVIEF